MNNLVKFLKVIILPIILFACHHNSYSQTTITTNLLNLGIPSISRVLQDGSGNYFVYGGVGSTTATLTGCSGTLSVYRNFIGKFDPVNNCWAWVYVFQNDFPVNNRAIVTDFVIDGNGNVFATGELNGTVTFAPGISKTAGGYADIFIMKIAGGGAVSWVTQAGTSNTDWGSAILLDNSGNLYVSGTYNRFQSNITTGAGSSSIFMGKYWSSDGVNQWVKTYAGGANFNGWSATTEGKGIAVDESGNVYQVGYQSGNISLTTKIKLASSGSLKDGVTAFLIKYNSAGTPQWAINAKNHKSYTSVVKLDNSGNIYTAGNWHDGTIDFGNGITHYQADTSWLNIRANFITKFNSSGKAQWSRKLLFNLGGIDGIAVTANNNIFACGQTWYEQNSYVDIQGSGTRYFPSGQNNFMLVGYSGSGTFIDAIFPTASGTTSGTGTFNGWARGTGIRTISGGFMILGNASGNSTQNTTLMLDASNTISTSGANTYFLASFTNALYKTSGIHTINPGSGIKIYPNPARDIVFIESPHKSMNVYITDIAGKVMTRTILSEGVTPMNLTELKPGIYFLRSSDNFICQKIIKQ